MPGCRWTTTAVLAVLLLAGCDRGGGSSRGGAGAEPGAPAVAAADEEPEESGEGPQLYRKACIMCHGVRGRGTQLGPALADAEWRQAAGGTAEAVAGVIRDGVPQPQEFPVPMPPRGDGTFSDDKIRIVAEYVGTLAR